MLDVLAQTCSRTSKARVNPQSQKNVHGKSGERTPTATPNVIKRLKVSVQRVLYSSVSNCRGAALNQCMQVASDASIGDKLSADNTQQFGSIHIVYFIVENFIENFYNSDSLLVRPIYRDTPWTNRVLGSDIYSAQRDMHVILLLDYMQSGWLVGAETNGEQFHLN